MTRLPRAGVVVIGRNEGERLRRCLQSCAGTRVVYVDSGSLDGSAALAAAMGSETVLLDDSAPFSAARARNEGFRRAREMDPEAEYVQFVDADCELDSEWLGSAIEIANKDPEVGIVSGRLREKRPDASIYNRLCDLEWDVPAGEIHSCGGIALARVTAFAEVGGFNSSIVAGEEADLCYRLRRAGWKVVRIDVAMGTHDAAMTRFDQWWRRAFRCGHAYAESAYRHGLAADRNRTRSLLSSLFWGAMVPIALMVSLVAGFWFVALWGVALGLALGYLALLLRVYRFRSRRDSRVDSLLYAFFCVFAKFPETMGVVKFVIGRVRGRPPTLIEYKSTRSRQG